MTKETVREAASGSAAASEHESASNVCVVDLGKQSSKRIKGLKRGKGRLMRKVDSIVRDLVDENVVPEGAAVVVVIVKKEAKTMMGMFSD